MGSSPDELRDMQRLVQRCWAHAGRPPVQFHIGDLAWSNREPERLTRVWREDGQPVAWGWLSPPAELEFAVSPDRRDLHDQILAWFEETAEPGTLSTWMLESDEAGTGALSRRGYGPADGAFFLHLARSLNDLPAAALPPSYRLAHVRGPAHVPRRVAVQRAAFASTMTEAKYRRLLATWPYRPELDIVVETAAGDHAAFCLAWLDEDNAVGELEPVGTHPEHARRGLARAACGEALRRLRELGARVAVVYARGDDEYTAPLRLYHSLGFEPCGRVLRFVLPR
jgi:ribosomal protein S18 acetylase RimI-like enzyme